MEEVVVMNVRGCKEFYWQGEYRIGRSERNVSRCCNGRCYCCCFCCPLFRCRHFSLSPWLIWPHTHPSPTLISPPFCWGVGPYRSCIISSSGGRNIMLVDTFPPFPSMSSIVCSCRGRNIVLVDTFPPVSVFVIVDPYRDM